MMGFVAYENKSANNNYCNVCVQVASIGVLFVSYFERLRKLFRKGLTKC